jgi:CheY-like chemotaxis protein
MFTTAWEILLVDDEPDVLSVSKLAMKGFEVYGLPLKIHTATSKAEAIDLLKRLTGLGGTPIVVAIIDVVMETDQAGLELCKYIRETMHNKTTQLYIRTGQPGIAPERNVIDDYDINGYFTKVEATEDKLYTLVKAGIRQVLQMGTAYLLSDVSNALLDAPTHEDMSKVLNYFALGVQRVTTGELSDTTAFRLGFLVDGNLVAGELIPEAQALDSQLGTPLSISGDKFVTDSDRNLLVKVVGNSHNSEVIMVARTTQDMPDSLAILYHRLLKAIGILWKQREAVQV